METFSSAAFAPPGVTFNSTMQSPSMRNQNRPRRFSLFRTRATVSSNPRMAAATGTPQETIRFEALFSDPSNATVLTLENEPISLIEHVQSRNAAGETVLLGWLRHFGCTLCKKQTSDWITIQSRLEHHGKLCMTLIGNGPPRHAVNFVEEMNWNGYIFTDPERRTYKALQFRAGLLATFNLPALRKVITSFRKGNKQTWRNIPTDAFQQGGAVLVDKNGTVRLFHADAFAGDHCEMDQLVREICAIL